MRLHWLSSVATMSGPPRTASGGDDTLNENEETRRHKGNGNR
jgi:hypothetical protein